jgi:hypothetical protein
MTVCRIHAARGQAQIGLLFNGPGGGSEVQLLLLSLKQSKKADEQERKKFSHGKRVKAFCKRNRATSY